MTKIKVLCTGCSHTFDFTHPSVNTSKDMAKVTIACPKCAEALVMADYFIVMETVRGRTLRRQQEVPIDLPQSYHKKKPTIEPKTIRPVAHLPSSPLYGNPQLEAYKKALEQENNND